MTFALHAASLGLVALATGAVAQPTTTTVPSTVPATQRSLAPRVIRVDAADVRGPRSKTYQVSVGAGRVAEGLRADWQRHLKTAKEAIGFEYLRCHGLLHDELAVYREDAAGNPVYNFQHIDLVYDYLLSIGVRPFVEIGFMPEALASIPTRLADEKGMLVDPTDPTDAKKKRRVSVFWWKANVTPPASYAKWDALVTALVKHWTDRYGADEVARWYFEVWNEPNHHAFFSPTSETTRRDEYFELYAHTARAVRAVDARYRVGGPSTAGPVWVPELIAFCAKDAVPLDFISFHAYGNAGGPGGLDEFGEGLKYLNANNRSPSGASNSQTSAIARSAMPQLPVHITEWSSSFSDRDPVHDTYFNAAYVLENLKRTERLGSMSYWTFTDVFEENGPAPRPFHGGFGLINLQGIKKPTFFAYAFLNKLGDELLADESNDERAWVTRDARGGVQALFWDLDDPRPAGVTNNVYFREVRTPRAAAPVTIDLSSLTPGTYRLDVYATGYEKNDAYTAWAKLGSPATISRADLAHLHAKTTGEPATSTVEVGEDGTWRRTFPITSNEVTLVTLTPVP